jgi:hypothetical protein
MRVCMGTIDHRLHCRGYMFIMPKRALISHLTQSNSTQARTTRVTQHCLLDPASISCIVQFRLQPPIVYPASPAAVHSTAARLQQTRAAVQSAAVTLGPSGASFGYLHWRSSPTEQLLTGAAAWRYPDPGDFAARLVLAAASAAAAAAASADADDSASAAAAAAAAADADADADAVVAFFAGRLAGGQPLRCFPDFQS